MVVALAAAAVAAVALVAGPAAAAPAAAPTAQGAATCPLDHTLTAYIADMEEDARLAVTLSATTQRLLDRLPPARDARWAQASRQVDVLAQSISHYVEEGGGIAPPRRLRAAHATLTMALIALFQVAAPLSGALEVGDTLVVATARSRFAAAAQALKQWRAAVTAAATAGRMALPAWMLAAEARPPVACRPAGGVAGAVAGVAPGAMAGS